MFEIKEILEDHVRVTLRIPIQGNRFIEYTRQYIENGEITAYPNFDYEKLFYQYKDEMIKNIESTFKTSYYHAEGILDQAKQKWKRK